MEGRILVIDCHDAAPLLHRALILFGRRPGSVSKVKNKKMKIMGKWLLVTLLVLGVGGKKSTVFFIQTGGILSDVHRLCIQSAVRHHKNVTLWHDSATNVPILPGVTTKAYTGDELFLGTPLQVTCWSHH